MRVLGACHKQRGNALVSTEQRASRVHSVQTLIHYVGENNLALHEKILSELTDRHWYEHWTAVFCSCKYSKVWKRLKTVYTRWLGPASYWSKSRLWALGRTVRSFWVRFQAFFFLWYLIKKGVGVEMSCVIAVKNGSINIETVSSVISGMKSWGLVIQHTWHSCINSQYILTHTLTNFYIWTASSRGTVRISG